MKKKLYWYRVDCATHGIRTTQARSDAEAMSRVKWQLRQMGIRPVTTFWGDPVRGEEVAK